MTKPRSTAVVLGAGIAGLLTAGVLAQFYDSVTVIERDALPDRPAQRPGVPQGRHVHSFLPGGTAAVEELLPGFLDRLAAAGAVVVDDADLSRTRLRIGGEELNRTGRLADPAALTGYQAGRPLFEHTLRRHLLAHTAVTILSAHRAGDLLTTDGAVTGVRITSRRTGVSTALHTDLVVDARGRGGRIPAFLTEHGFDAPPEQRAGTTLAYASQPLQLPPDAIAERLTVTSQSPTAPAVLLLAQERDTAMLATASAPAHGRPPTGFGEMLDLVAPVLPESVLAGLQRATPIGEPSIWHTTAAAWRRYDLLERFPAGLLVIGDALCTLNPLHGQGMTMAALQALALRDCLATGEVGLARRFFAAAAARIRPVWAMNATNDRTFALDATLSPDVRLRRWITAAVLRAAATDIGVAERLVRVRGLVDSPARLHSPALLWRVLRTNRRDRRRPAAPGGPAPHRAAPQHTTA